MMAEIKTSDHKTSQHRGFFCLTILLLLIVPGNLLSLELFLGVDFIFGNVFVFLIAFLFNPVWAILAGVISSFTGYFIWGHIMTAPVFVAEALTLSLLYHKRRKGNPIDYVILFWLILGVPLSLVSYKLSLNLSWFKSAFIVGKQFLNSLFSASLCGLLLYLPISPVKSRDCNGKGRLVSVYDLFSSLLIFFMISIVLGILILESRNFEKRSTFEVKERLISTNESIITYLSDWQRRHEHLIFRMSYQISQFNMDEYSDELQSYLELFQESLPGYNSMYIGNSEGYAIASAPRINLQGEDNIGNNFSDRDYFKRVKNSLNPVFSSLLVSRTWGKNFVGFSMPVRIDGMFRGYILGEVFLEPMSEALRNFKINSHQGITLIDPEGKVIVSTESYKANDLFQSEDGGERVALGDGVLHWFLDNGKVIVESLGKSYLYNKSYLPELGWTLYIREPLSSQFESLLEMSLRNIIISILLILTMIPILKGLFYSFARGLDHLLKVSSCQIGDSCEDLEWPESGILEFHNLIYQVKTILDQQSVNSLLMKEQNRKLKGMNSALVRSEENLRTTLNSIGDGVIVSDADGKIININPVVTRICGWAFESVYGREVTDLLSLKEEFSGITLPFQLDKVIKKGESIVSGKPYLLEDLEGNTSTVTVGAEPIRISQEAEIRGAVIVIRNNSETRRLEEQLRQSQKMEVVGQLAGGIAHDFNNLLAGIIGLNELIIADLPEDSPAGGYSKGVSDLVMKAADLTRKLLAFSRKGKMTSKVFNVHDVIDETVEILDRTINKSIRIEKKFEAKSFHIAGDPTQIQSVFMNIALNARDAMPEGGSLTFHTTQTRGMETVETSTGIRMISGPHICITITDNGSGIDSESLPHIFEPFYTSKGIGQGSGMGLPAVYGAVSEHNGMISVQSEEGHGTSFLLYLPIVKSDKVLYKPDELTIMRGEETILVIDDEEIIRNSLRAILTELGYHVFTSSGGKEGLALYRDKADSIALIILDAVMPDMSGLDVLNALKELNPLVRVVIATGYSSEARGDQFRDAGALDFIPKPFTIGELNNRIRRILNA